MSSRPDLTPQQQAAIETRDVSVALSAGAGCGKTTVLTARFLSHLEPGPDVAQLSELVAITFTDRAAREMRDRIRKACRERLQNCPAAQAEHWLAVLYGLDSARIATIHSFCNSLLRGHAVEAGLDPGFIVSDAPQTAALAERSARETLHRLLEQYDEDAATLVLHFGLEQSRNILATLISQRFQLSADLSSLNAQHFAAKWPEIWRTTCVPALVNEFRAAPICELTSAWLRDHRPDKTSVMHDRCRAVQAWLASTADWSQPEQALEQIRESAKVQGGGGKSVWQNAAEHDEVKDLFEGLRKQADRCLERIAFNPTDVQFAAELAERGSRLAAAAIADYESLKRQAGRLDFDDLLLMARDLLKQHPQVSQKLAGGIRLLMVDEFQDTDQVQADLIRLLCGPALAAGKLFLVGDAQQSIYRFRRADPRVFADFQSQIRTLPLNVNFRSQPEILDFVNHLFARALGADFQALTPAEDRQISPRPTIEFLWATSDVAPGSAGDDGVRQTVDLLRRREADWISLRIAELLADPTPRIRGRDPEGRPTLRPTKPGDITILFRTLSDASLYEHALDERGIEYYLVGGKAFYAQQEIFDLLNLCRHLMEPADEISLVGCLRSPFFNLSDDAIHALRLADQSLALALNQAPPNWLTERDQHRVQFAAQVLRDLHRLKDRLTPSELLEAAIDRTGYDAALLHEHLGPRKLANLRKLIGQAAEFDDGGLFTLNDFVGQLERSINQQTDEEFAPTLPEAGNVVRLMTIHQSKGLEFPVVFVADMNRKGQSRTSSVLLHSDWGALLKPPDEFGQSREHLGLRIYGLTEEPDEAAEIVRLLYVATTRAADRLILSSGMTPDLKPESPWMMLLAERFNLATGLLSHDPYLGSHSGAGAGRARIPHVQIHPQPPPSPAQKSTKERLVPLAQLPSLLADAELEELPESFQTYPAATDWLGPISVSALEQLLPGHEPVRRLPDFDDSEERSSAPADVVGTLVHAVLQRLDLSQPDDWPNVLAGCVASTGSTSSDGAIAQEAAALIEQFVNSPLCGTLATGGKRFREIDFLLNWPPDAASPRAVLTGQIDLLQETDAGWQLLDYKTGRFPTSIADAELIGPYALQLGIYALAAERMLGEPLASVGLIAMRPIARVLEFPWNDREREQLITRIQELLTQ